jgi:anti-anti-sigma factor
METHIECPPEPCLRKKLKETLETMSEEVVNLSIDLSKVSTVTGSSISKLLRLREILEGRKGKVILCNVSPQTRGIFRTTNLEKVFEIL